MVGRTLRSRRSSRKFPRADKRVLRSEWLEPRTMLSGSGFSSLLLAGMSSPGWNTTVEAAGRVKPVGTLNAAPTLARMISVNGNAPVTGKTASLSVLGQDDGGESKLLYTWSVTAKPSGGTATFGANGTNAAKATTMAFTKAGAYAVTLKVVDGSGLSTIAVASVTVTSTLTGLSVTTSTGQLVGSGSTLAVSGVSQSLIASALDQFGVAMSGAPALAWSASSLPQGASVPNFTTSGSNTTITFGSAGRYTVSARLAGATSAGMVATVNVTQKLTSIVVSPNATTLAQGASKLFTAQGLDQFSKAMSSAPVFAWSATSGTITSAGLFTAPVSGGSCTVAATSGSVKGMATVSAPVNAAPSVASPIVVNGNVPVTGKAASLSVLGADDGGESKLVYTWSVTAKPTGGTATFGLNGVNGAKATTMTFTKAGTYGVSVRIVDAGGLSTTVATSVVVTPTLTSFSVSTALGQVVGSGSTLVVSGASQSLVSSAVDQFGSTMSGTPALVWSVSALSQGASTPGLTSSGNNTTITFGMAGRYSVSARLAGATTAGLAATVTVNQTLTSIAVSPNTTTLAQGATQQFSAQGLDQFRKAMSSPPAFVWSATGGTITSAGLFTVSASGTSCTVTAKVGSVSGTAAVSVLGNAAPTVASSIVVNGNLPVTGTTAALSVMGADDRGESNLVYNWSVLTSPTGGSAAFGLNGTNGAKTTTMTFTKAGTYGVSVRIVDAGGLSVTTTTSFVVQPAFAGFRLSTTAGLAVNYGSALVMSGVSQSLVVSGLDSSGNVVSGTPTLVWTTTSLPLVGSAPSFAANGAVTTITFKVAGSYTLSARLANSAFAPLVFSVYVDQALTSIALTPKTPVVLMGGSQQFTPQALDQFGKPMWNQQTFAWSATGGTINSAGRFTAPSSGTNCTVTAKVGTVTGTVTVSLLDDPTNLHNAALATLVQSLDADGSISRLDMIQILRSVGADGVVDTTEFGDLKRILGLASTLNMPGYVQSLAEDVINGNLANATFQGQALGDLAVGTTAAQLNMLVDKWFLGADHPTLCNTSLVYNSVAGSLFPYAPSHTDEFQGSLGDCYFISALGTLADSNPAAVQNMFVDNGDGTFTVRFYTGNYGTIYNSSDGSIGAGFKDNFISVDYVTVDRMLPTSASGMLAYAGYGDNCLDTTNSLWIPLAEKAYAQWNETGKAGRDGLNAYASIQGGWMATVDAQVLGYNATDYLVTAATTKQVAINALAAHKATTIGTLQWTGTRYGLYANHAYAIVGYSASTDTFTLYNPWGSDQPGQLTWAQIQSSCSQLAVADTSGTTPIVGAPSKLRAVQASLPDWTSDAVWVAKYSKATLPAGRSHDVLLPPAVDAMFAGNSYC